MMKPTERALAVLEYIEDHPCSTVREICAHFGWRSPNAVRNHIVNLKRCGMLMNDPRKARTYTRRTRRLWLSRARVILPVRCASCGDEHFCLSDCCKRCQST